MTTDWPKVSLVDIANFKTGTLNSNASVENGLYPFFTCSPETFRINDYAFDQKVILLAGNNAEGKFNAYQRTYIIDIIHWDDLKYLFYALKLCLNQFKLLSQDTSTHFLTMGILENFSIPNPPLPIQRTIAATLSCLDNKIELNNRINANLEAQAGAIFKSWFVDFEPFQGGEFVDSELGKIPKRWRVGTLGAYCKITTGKLDANARVENGKYRFYTCAKDYYLIDDYAFDTEAILVSGNGEYVGYINYFKGKFNAYQRTYVIDDFKISVAYIKCFLQLFLKERIINQRRGSSTPYIVLGTLADFEMVIPPKEVLEKYNNVAFNLLKQAENNKEQSRTLAAIRDILLPRLMSGEIEVPTKEKL
ncbi:MAG: restriction endonuclease subunit S [Termitinemataceae bacterium]|nr:MAG: restriction endonuclease subunit S [Termitinemataceae bacterium]